MWYRSIIHSWHIIAGWEQELSVLYKTSVPNYTFLTYHSSQCSLSGRCLWGDGGPPLKHLYTLFSLKPSVLCQYLQLLWCSGDSRHLSQVTHRECHLLKVTARGSLSEHNTLTVWGKWPEWPIWPFRFVWSIQASIKCRMFLYYYSDRTVKRDRKIVWERWGKNGTWPWVRLKPGSPDLWYDSLAHWAMTPP